MASLIQEPDSKADTSKKKTSRAERRSINKRKNKPSPVAVEDKAYEKEEDDEIDYNTWECEHDFIRSNHIGMSDNSRYVQGTTLLKPLPYNGIRDFYKDPDERRAYKEMIRAGYLDDDDGYYRNTLWFHELTGCQPGKDYIETGPAFQVISITILNKDSSWKGSQIYGQISIDHYDSRKRFFFYKKSSDNPSPVSPHTNLSSDHRLVAPVMRGKLHFCLFTSDGTQIFDTNVDIDYSIHHNDGFEDQKDVVSICGNHGYYLKMGFTITPHAFVSDVGFALVGPSDSQEETFFVDGEITANSVEYLTGKELKLVSRGHGSTTYYVPKSRYTIAIPVLSMLLFEFNVTMCGKEFAIGERQFFPSKSSIVKHHFDIKDKPGYYFHLDVDWQSPSGYFQHFPDEIRHPKVSNNLCMEVFSVVLCGGSTPHLCGTIVVRDQKETVYIFSRNRFRPDKHQSVSGKLRLSLAWPTDRFVRKDSFYMHLNLKDEEGRLLCRGGLGCNRNSYPSQFDRRVCAVIPGEDDYFAVVHYSIFMNALRARVTVTTECKSFFDRLDVWGTVYARYNNYDYSSSYDTEYNQIVIFDRAEEYRAKVKNCSEIPLSKSLVTAPANCSKLSIEVRLKVCPLKGSMYRFDHFALGILPFEAGTNACQELHLYRAGDDWVSEDQFQEMPIFLVPSDWRVGRKERGTVKVKVDWLPSVP